MESGDLDRLSWVSAQSGFPGSQVKLVRAKFNFRPSNNDELSFDKDDIITLTQCPTGGWWEGTFNGTTGWFPSNYTQPLSASEAEEVTAADSHHYLINNATNNSDSDTQQYRQMVFQDIEDTESAFVRDMNDTISKYLKPLQNSHILPEIEINSVVRTVEDIVAVHHKFLSALNLLNTVSHKDRRIGGVFLDFAPHIKAVHLEYCSNHAKFVHSIEKSKKEICSLFSSLYPSEQSAGNVLLTACLSSSFRRLDKYPALLQELQRYTNEDHSDRGDTQRAGFVYRELSMSCLELRRRKEMELEVMLGNIKNCDQIDIQSLGEIVRMDAVSMKIVPDYTEMKKDRFLVLFPQTLLVLSVSSEMTSFLFEAKLKLEEIIIKTSDELKDSTNIFEISSAASSRSFIIQCNTIEDAKSWCDLLKKQIVLAQTFKYSPNFKNADQSSGYSGVRSSNSDGSTSGSNVFVNSLTPQMSTPTAKSRYWMNKCLTPHPPTRIRPTGIADKSNDYKEKQLNANEDMLLLQVIESYCNTPGIRRSNSSAQSDNPHVFIIDDSADKPVIDSSQLMNNFCKTNCDPISTETETSLREEIKKMKLQIQYISDSLKAERRSRKKLKALVMERNINTKMN